jgi:4-diphosphocytidyl-2-C-methyl-D-erythritol kinase
VKNLKIKSYCKINLSLRVTKKLNDGYHNILSLITFCHLHDKISISQIKSKKDKISFSGKFKKGIDKKSNTTIDVLCLLRNSGFLKNKFFKIDIKKNIPHGSGIGGASANAADLINYFNSKMKLKLNNNEIEKIARKVGFDVPVNLKKKNTFLTGKKNEILRLKQKFKLSLLIVYPNLICSTKKIFEKNRIISLKKTQNLNFSKNNKKLINILKKDKNDLEKTVIKIYPKIKKVIDYIKSQKGCYFSRITGSGSACIGIFSNIKNANYAKKSVKLKYPKYWCVTSKTI